jgi:hypothetical protein
MSKKRKSKGITYKGYLHLPAAMTAHQDFIELSAHGVSLLIDVAQQYNGYNNGDLCASMSIMKQRGWTSNDTLSKRLKELVGRGWILKSRTGGLGMGPDLYAITWQPIDECNGKIDISPTMAPPRTLKE